MRRATHEARSSCLGAGSVCLSPRSAQCPEARLLGPRDLQRRDVAREACCAAPEWVSAGCDEYPRDHAQAEQHDCSRQGPIGPSAWATAYGLVRAIRRHVEHRVLHQRDDRMRSRVVRQRVRLVRRRPRRGDLRDRCPVLGRRWRVHRRRLSSASRGKRLRVLAGAQGCIRHSELLADLHQRGLGIANGAGARRQRSGGFVVSHLLASTPSVWRLVHQAASGAACTQRVPGVRPERDSTLRTTG